MPVRILDDGYVVDYKLLESDDTANLFLLESEKGGQATVDVPLELDSSYADKNFDIYFLCKKDLKENEIFQVYIKEYDKRVGWIIPTLALSSTLHDFTENEHFLKYAFIAIRESLMRLDDSIFSNEVEASENKISYADIFHDFTAILVICRDALSDEIQFNIHRASPSLIKYGYVQLGSENPNRISLIMDAPHESRLNIEQVSSSIQSEDLISEILNHSLAIEESPIFKFFLLYQLFELLIEEIYVVEQATIVDELITVKGDSGKTKEGLEKLRKCTSESSRLGLLIEKYTTPSVQLTKLKNLCNVLLKNLGREEADDFQSFLYRVRNFVFHQYRDFPKAEFSNLEAIVFEMIEILPSILARFQAPKTTIVNPEAQNGD